MKALLIRPSGFDSGSESGPSLRASPEHRGMRGVEARATGRARAARAHVRERAAFVNNAG